MGGSGPGMGPTHGFRIRFVRVAPRIPDPDQPSHFEMKLRFNTRISETVSGG